MIELREVDALAGGRMLLRSISLQARKGEVLGLLGPNGAGKSTLSRVMAGLLPPRVGDVRVQGAPIRSLSRRELARRVAFLPQEAPPELPFTAEEVVLMGRTPHLGAMGIEGPADREIVAESLRLAEAEAFARRPIAALSGGERRRVLFARLLAQRAPIWILDEPTAHLDLAHQQVILRLARRHADAGGAVVCVLHDLQQAQALCDRIALLREGRLVATGTPEGMLQAERLEQVFGVPFTAADHPAGGPPIWMPALRLR